MTAKTKSTTPSPRTNWQRIKDAGKVTVLLCLTPEQIRRIDRAMEKTGVTHRTQFFTLHAIEAAEKILEK